MALPKPIYFGSTNTKMQAQTKMSKVTLTNWERLNNAPLPLAGVSAVQWNDYVFVLPQSGMSLLYHTKSKIWSLLPKSPHTNSKTSPPALTLHSSQIHTMSTLGQVATYDPHVGKWTENKNMKFSSSNIRHDCALISYNNILYTVIARESHTSPNPCMIYYNDTTFAWNKICEFGDGILTSAAMVCGIVFVHIGGEMYQVPLNKKPVTATKIAIPPYEGFTLYAIKDTLFSFGGRDRDNQPTSDVLRYNPDTETWESAGYMRSARYNVAVTTMQDTSLDVFVLGGRFGSSQYTTKQEESGFNLVPTMQSSAKYTWDNTTSIFEKCTVN